MSIENSKIRHFDMKKNTTTDTAAGAGLEVIIDSDPRKLGQKKLDRMMSVPPTNQQEKNNSKKEEDNILLRKQYQTISEILEPKSQSETKLLERIKSIDVWENSLKSLKREVAAHEKTKNEAVIEINSSIHGIQAEVEEWKRDSVSSEFKNDEEILFNKMLTILNDYKNFKSGSTSFWQKIKSKVAHVGVAASLFAGVPYFGSMYHESQSKNDQLSEIEKKADVYKTQDVPPDTLIIRKNPEVYNSDALFDNFKNSLTKRAKKYQLELLKQIPSKNESVDDILSADSFALDEEVRGLIGVYTKYHKDYNISEVYGDELAKKLDIKKENLGKFEQICDAMYYRYKNSFGAGVTRIDFAIIPNKDINLPYTGHEQMYNDQFVRTIDFAKRIINSEEKGTIKLGPEVLKKITNYIKIDWEIWAYTQKISDLLVQNDYKVDVVEEKLGIIPADTQRPIMKIINELSIQRDKLISDIYLSTNTDINTAKKDTELATAYEFINWWPDLRPQMVNSPYNIDLIPMIENFDQRYRQCQDLINHIPTSEQISPLNIATK